MKKIIFGIILSLIFVPGFFVFAQVSDEEIAKDTIEGSDWPAVGATANDVDCFDYYKFQSVIVSVGPDQQVYQPGTEMHFVGMVKNDNNYPVVDGNLFVRIGRANDNYMQEGQNIVDEFIAVKDISIDAKSEKKVDFIWNVPVYEGNGAYVVDYFFSVGKKFNLGGLSFSNEVTAGVARFNISSTITTAVAFDKSATTFNGDKYNQIGSWPKITAGSEVTINNVLRNSFGETKVVNVTQELYRWDSLNKDDRLDEKTLTVTVPANGTADISYKVPDTSGSVYYLKTIASYDDTKSIINVRFATDAPRARLNYPAITKFPIKKGDAFTLFSCFHNSTNVNTSGNVRAVLSDRDGNEIGELKYDGNIPSAMSAAKTDISARRDYDYVGLKAEIRDKDGNVVDHYEITYDCAQLNECKTVDVSGLVGMNGFVKIFAYVVLFIVTIIIIIVLIRIIKGYRGPRLGIFIFGLLVTGGVLSSHGTSAAGDQTALSSSPYNLSNGYATISTGDVTLNSYMNVTSTSVPCGGSVSFGYGSDLTFNASGGSWDTPYGTLCSNYTSASCFGNNLPAVGQYISGNGARGGYIYFTGSQPGNPSLVSNNPSVMTCSGMTCAAVAGASGTARITAKLNGSTVRIWSLIAYYKPRCEEFRTPKLSCGGSILGQNRCTASNSTYWVSPTDEHIGCGGGNTQYTNPSFTTMSLGGTTLYWDITVGSCVVPINGVCNSASTRNNYVYTATGPSTPLCSAGTPSPATVSFPSGAYGVDSTVTWTCNGSGGGTNATCSAARLAPSYTCTGTPPQGAIWCMGDDINITTNTAWQQVAVCTDTQKCEYTMPAYSCTGGNPPQGATWCLGDDGGLIVNTPWQQVTACTDTQKCEYTMPPASNGECGLADGQTYFIQPSSNLCDTGNVIWTDQNASDGRWNWECEGLYGGTNTICSAIKESVPDTTTTVNDDTDIGSDGRMIETRP
ncbi:MAG: hypothetical protein WC819_05580 [Parcubacteria group bacterium]|jgi:hypothetical protein